MAAALLRRTREMLQYVRLRSFDTDTEEGRSAERHRRVALTALASAAARVTTIGTSLITVPLTLHYLGAERYGMWMTMSAITAMLSFADFGIGNGVLTAVAQASGRDDLTLIRRYVSSAFALLGSIAAVILLLLTLAYSHVAWHELFNVSSPLARAEAGPAIAIFLSCFALSLPFSIVQRVQMGLQMGFMASLWQCVASITALAGVLIAIWFEAGLPWLVAAFIGAPLLISLLNGLLFFARIRPEFAPRRELVSRTDAHELARVGALFFVLQMAVAVTFTSDTVVIAHALGAAAVPSFSIADRLFAIASTLVGLAVTPLWPAFGEAIARNDRAWARVTLLRATAVSAAISGMVCMTLLVAAPWLIELWVDGAVNPPFGLLLGLAVWRTVEATASASSMYLNGLRAVSLQVGVAIVTGVIAITAKIMLIPYFGLAITPWCTIVPYIFFTIVPVILFLRKRL